MAAKFAVGAMILACFALFACGVSVGLKVGVRQERAHLRSEIVKHNAGYYDSKTGDFKWNDEKAPDKKGKK